MKYRQKHLTDSQMQQMLASSLKGLLACPTSDATRTVAVAAVEQYQQHSRNRWRVEANQLLACRMPMAHAGYRKLYTKAHEIYLDMLSESPYEHLEQDPMLERYSKLREYVFERYQRWALRRCCQ